MKKSFREEIINHSADNLFNIVLDIEKYPDYIPWCSSMVIHSHQKNEILADMFVNYKFILNYKFGSKINYNRKNFTIKTQYIEGPLKNLKSNWKFIPLEKNKTKINFLVNFKFKNYFHQKIAESFYPLIENKMIESFKARAKKILN